MPIKLAYGLQWGDEGKGKIIDYLADDADIVVRAAGGANAGHTIKTGGKKFVLHLVPSGIVHENTRCLMGGGMVIDPHGLLSEIKGLMDAGISDVWERLGISPNAHMIISWHRTLEKIRENKPNAIGTTLRGIGPAYETRASRFGLPIALLNHPEKLQSFLKRLAIEFSPIFEKAGEELPNPIKMKEELVAISEPIVKSLTNVSLEIHNSSSKNILLEGAQGSLLDIIFGTYPFVTSSSTISGGILSGCGIGPSVVSHSTGVVKAYTTRVGNGPFPTELNNEIGNEIASTGGEFGATTGRPRRCGWLDMVALRHTLRLTGTDSMALTKSDVLAGFDEIEVATAYRTKSGDILNDFPADPFILSEVEPVYETLPAWKKGDYSNKIPNELTDYINFIEANTNVPIKILSFGPNRHETIKL